MQSDCREVEDKQHYSCWLIFFNSINGISAVSCKIWYFEMEFLFGETSTESTTVDPQLNQIYCSANLSLSWFKSPLILPFPLPPSPPPLGFPDTPCHRPVFYGTRLGAAVLVKLHPEDTGGHGHVEPLLFLRLCLHLPVDLSPVSLHDESPDFLRCVPFFALQFFFFFSPSHTPTPLVCTTHLSVSFSLCLLC